MATRKPNAKPKSPKDIKRAIATIEAEIAKAKKARENSGETFSSLTREELVAKLNRAESPIITWQSWSGSAPPGGTINYTVGVSNPDPVSWVWLVVAVSFGNRNPIVSNDVFLSDFDSRFPTFAQPGPLGFSLGPVGSPTASSSFSFVLNVPAGIEKTSYFGNTILQQLDFHDVGKYLDRAAFLFEVI
jgi:hypothetical protein